MGVQMQVIVALLALAAGTHCTQRESFSPFGVSVHQHRRFSRQTSDGVDWNGIADRVLLQVKDQILHQGLDDIVIPDIHEVFERNLGLFTAKGRFEAWEGMMSNVSSLRRSGDVTHERVSDNSVLITAYLTFDILKFHYNHYVYKYLGVGPRGKIDASVGANLIKLDLQLDTDDDCTLSLVEVKVVELDDVKVKITGLGKPLNWLASKIVTSVTGKKGNRAKIIARIEQTIDLELRDVLANTTLSCS